MPSRHAPHARTLSRRMAAAFLVCGLLVGNTGTANAGSLPEPIIDPNMGAGPSAAPSGPLIQPPQARLQGPVPQRQMSVVAQTPQRQPSTPEAQPGVQPPPPVVLSEGPPPVRSASPAVQAAILARQNQAATLPPPSALEASLQESLQMLAMAGARQVAPHQARVVVELGRLDPRLRLAPCEQIQPYLPPTQRMWGRTRIGIRCLSGPTKWNVSLPLTIRVFAPAYIAASDLPTGTELTQEHLRLAETDIAGEAGVIYTQPDGWVGRHLAKGLMAGEALRSTDLKLRQWVQPGDRVQVQAAGQGYAVSGEGQAMGVGLEGQDVRIRFDNGRMVTGRTVGERKVEVLL